MKKFIEELKLKLIKLVEYMHLKFFGHEMSDTMREFLQNLSWSFFGGITAAIIMFVVQILAARWLGVEGFGKYNAVLSFATSLGFFLLLGNDISSVRFLSDKKYKKEQKSILASSLGIIFLQILITTAILFFAKEYFIKYFSIQNKFYILGILLAIIFACKTMIDGYLRAFMLIKQQSIIRVIDALLVVGAFILIRIVYKDITYVQYVWMMIFGAGSFIIFGSALISKRVGNIKFKNIAVLSNYSKFILIASVGGFLMSLEKLLIGKYLGLISLGIFSAYQMMSFLILANMGGIFMNVFLPSAIKEKHQIFSLTSKLNILFMKAFIPWIILSGILTFLTISFMGKGYTVAFSLIFLFSVSAYISFVFTVLVALLNINNVRKSAYISLLCYSIIIGSIPFVQNIKMYLGVQIIIFLLFYLVSKKYLLKRR